MRSARRSPNHLARVYVRAASAGRRQDTFSRAATAAAARPGLAGDGAHLISSLHSSIRCRSREPVGSATSMEETERTGVKSPLSGCEKTRLGRDNLAERGIWSQFRSFRVHSSPRYEIDRQRGRMPGLAGGSVSCCLSSSIGGGASRQSSRWCSGDADGCGSLSTLARARYNPPRATRAPATASLDCLRRCQRHAARRQRGHSPVPRPQE